jgi:hypothetical protein
MNILLFGAGGAIGQAIAAELTGRGHAVTGITRSGEPVEELGIQFIAGDATDPATVATLTQGVGAVVSAAGPLVAVARGLTEGMRMSGASRLVVAGGADDRALSEVYLAADDLDWTYLSPAAGTRKISTGDFAVAVADVIDNGGPLRQQVTVAS